MEPDLHAAAAKDRWTDPAWPPGTVRLELLKEKNNSNTNNKNKEDVEIILQPRPTTDPNDPLNWPQWRKYLNFGLAAFYALMVFAQINATTPTWGPMGDELDFDTATLNGTYAIGCATLALGAFMLIPFALKYGLRPLYVLSSAAQLAVMVWAARTRTAADWWGVNAVQCWLGSLGECLVQMTVADVFFVHQRGMMNSIYVWAANVGGNLLVVAAGYITLGQGWRWVWWWCAIVFAVQLVMFVFLFEESKFDWTKAEAVAISHQHAESATPEGEVEKKKTTRGVPFSDTEKHAQLGYTSLQLTRIQIDPNIPRKTYLQKLISTETTKGPWQLFARHAYQPFQIMVTIPGVSYVCILYAVLLSYGTVMSAATSTYMIQPPYNFNSSQIGLMKLAEFAGNTVGILICGPASDWLILKLAKRNNGIYEPEMRLWALVPFIPFMIAGPFWYGYTLQNGDSWVSVAFASAIYNFASAPISGIGLTYMTDAYNEIIGDALVALTFSRNTLSTVFVFAMDPWIGRVGMANVFNTIGSIGIVVLLFVFILIWRGKQWRFRTARTYEYYAGRQFHGRPIKDQGPATAHYSSMDS